MINYSDTSGSLWQFKRDKVEGNVDLTLNNSPPFKYKSSLFTNKNGVTKWCKNSCTAKISE